MGEPLATVLYTQLKVHMGKTLISWFASNSAFFLSHLGAIFKEPVLETSSKTFLNKLNIPELRKIHDHQHFQKAAGEINLNNILLGILTNIYWSQTSPRSSFRRWPLSAKSSCLPKSARSTAVK